MELERKMEFEQDDEIEENGGMDSPAKPENDIGERPGESAPGELDLPPEFCQYRDEGCEMAESCLNCPFAECIYDEQGGKKHRLKKLRSMEIARLHTIEGKDVKELAKMFGISERTVQRALKAVGATGGRG